MVQKEVSKVANHAPESIADYMKRPLYRLSSSTVMDEEKLLPALSNAQRWDAIVLMDEADVFMQRRDSHNINHNNSVSSE